MAGTTARQIPIYSLRFGLQCSVSLFGWLYAVLRSKQATDEVAPEAVIVIKTA